MRRCDTERRKSAKLNVDPARTTGGDVRSSDRLLTEVERAQVVNGLNGVTSEIVDDARPALPIGP